MSEQAGKLRCDQLADDWRYDDDDGTCCQCGGSGVLEGLCTCMDDTCCCLHPEPPECDWCGGAG